MSEVMDCLAYMPHFKLVLVSAVALGVAIGGVAAVIALGVRP